MSQGGPSMADHERIDQMYIDCIANLRTQLTALRTENQRLRDELATTEAREWQRYPLGRV